jgi:hypothetical protein
MASPWQVIAMKERHVGVAVICMTRRYVVFDNGVVMPITAWLDDDRNKTDDMEQAAFYEFGTPEFGYGIGSLDAYDMPSFSDH